MTQMQTQGRAKSAATGGLGSYAQKYGILIALVLACVVLALINENFLSTRNILNVLRQTSINGVLAIGMTFVILTRGIDLSVGSVVALTGVVAASFATTSTAGFIPGALYPAPLALAIGVAVGMLAGSVSGLIVARFRVPAFVATLGMLSAARGMTLLYSGGRPIPALTDTFRWIGTGDVLGVPVPIFVLLAVFAGAHFVLTQTRFGRHVYAVGATPCCQGFGPTGHAHPLHGLCDFRRAGGSCGHDPCRAHRIGPATGGHCL